MSFTAFQAVYTDWYNDSSKSTQSADICTKVTKYTAKLLLILEQQIYDNTTEQC